MSWRNQGITGSNNIPLGKRRFGGDAEDGVANGGASPNGGYSNGPSSNGAPSNGFSNGDHDVKRGRSPERESISYVFHLPFCSTVSIATMLTGALPPGSEHDGPKRRKKRNRWGEATDNKAAGLMGLPTAILADMTSEQLEAYTLHLRIEEITQKLKIDDVVPADGDRYVSPSAQVARASHPPSCAHRLTTPRRSPSPPPQYDNHGRRVNTREHRYRKRLEDERHKLIEKAMKTIPNYHPPQDYRRPTKTQEKVYVPVNDYPEINFSMIANPLTLLTTLLPFPLRRALPCARLCRRPAAVLCLARRPCWTLTRITVLPFDAA